MKQLMMMALMMCSTLAYSQESEWVPGKSNDIDLKLENIYKFGKQHRTGNHLIIIGGLLTGIGSITLYNSLSNKELYGKQDNPNIYKTIVGLGSVLSVTGFIINIDSFKHLRKL